MMAKPKFFVGQIVYHSRFDYRGVVVDVDGSFQGSEAWYEQVARSRPPKDQPWYRVLVDGGEHETYVAERPVPGLLLGRTRTCDVFVPLLGTLESRIDVNDHTAVVEAVVMNDLSDKKLCVRAHGITIHRGSFRPSRSGSRAWVRDSPPP